MALAGTIAAGALSARRGAPVLVATVAGLVLFATVTPVALIIVLVGALPGNGTGNPVADIPAEYQRLYTLAGRQYHLDWAILAAIGKIETDHGRSTAPGVRSGVNTYGCCAGPMQFSIIPRPSTWDMFGVDGNHDGDKDVYDPADAIPAAARYLRAGGAPSDYHAAILAYNHAEWYYQQVMAQAAEYRAAAATTVTAPPSSDWLARVPGGQECDRRIVPDVLALIRVYHVAVTACYAPTGHAADGEHPLGLATDLVPGTGGTWDDVDRLARWAEPAQDHPRAPFRWVGYDGDPNHGRGNHLHLSWLHGPGRPAETVTVFTTR